MRKMTASEPGVPKNEGQDEEKETPGTRCHAGDELDEVLDLDGDMPLPTSPAPKPGVAMRP